jgi:hypothetical protein
MLAYLYTLCIIITLFFKLSLETVLKSKHLQYRSVSQYYTVLNLLYELIVANDIERGDYSLDATRQCTDRNLAERRVMTNKVG